MAPKRSEPLAVASASDEDALSGFQAVQRPSPTKSPLAPAPADQEISDGEHEMDDGDEVGSSDEIGENGVLVKHLPPPQGMAAAVVETSVGSPEASQLKRKAAAAAATGLAKSPPRKRKASPPPKGKAAAAAAATGLAKSPPSKRKALPPPKGKAAAAAPELAKSPPQVEELPPEDVEKHFKKKSETHWHLWQMVQTLEKEYGLSFKGAFLKINDAKATILESKIKKQNLLEIKQQSQRKEVEANVIKALVKLIR